MEAASARQKRLGAFYTPAEMAEKLVAWAVREPSDRVLDPSFGGLVFLEAGRARLATLGAAPAALADQLIGVDLDERALAAARGAGLPSGLVHSDFFDLVPGQDLHRCEAVVGNPPYIRYQGWDSARALALCAAAGVRLTRLASSWAPFLVHATDFVAPGGRLAMVLPAEMLHAQYAGEVQAFLARSFGRLRLALFEERVFPGALEEVVLLLAEERGESASGIELLDYETLGDFEPRALPRAPRPTQAPAPHRKLLAQLLPEAARESYARLAGDARVGRLSAFGSSGIGAVTGDNSFFLLDDERADSLPAVLLRPAVSKARHVQGVRFTTDDLDALRASGQPMQMFVADARTSGKQLAKAAAYLAEGRAKGVDQRYKCRVRNPWWSVPLPKGGTPQLFMTYCANEHPRLVLNEAAALSTNTLHGLYLRDPRRARGLAAGFLNSLTLLSAELVGRSYGGGVLKLEPTEAQALLLPPLSGIGRKLEQLDRLLREEGLGAVLAITDRLLLREALGLSADEVSALREGHEKLRRRRKARGKAPRR
jgi:adenine-specific DNA-methyltransferase